MSNRERLVDAAAELFHRQGYRGTSLEELLERTGVSRSNLYYHFRGKAALALAVVRRWIERYDEELVAPSLGRHDLAPVERVALLFERAAATQDPEAGRTGCALGRLATDLSDSDPEVRALLQGYFTGLADRVEETLAAAGGIGRFEARRLAQLTVATLEGGLFLSDLHRDGAQIGLAGESLVALLRGPAERT